MIRSAEYKEGEIVLTEGQLGKGFCILESGVLEVVREDKVLSEIETTGSIFGELSEILGIKRDAAIRAKTDSKVRHVEESIEVIVTKNPKVGIKLIRTLGRRLYRMNRIAAKEVANKDTHHAKADSSKVGLLVVDDQPAIIQQLKELAERNDWVAQGAGSEAEAIAICETTSFDAILISMALPDDAACINKPFDRTKTEATLYEVMQLDSSARYFEVIDDFLFFKLPEVLSNFIINDINENMDNRINSTINAGIVKMIIDVSDLEEVGEEAVEVVGEFAEKIEELKLPMRAAIVAVGEEAEMWNNLDGAEEWGICENLDEAKEFLARDPEEDEEE